MSPPAVKSAAASHSADSRITELAQAVLKRGPHEAADLLASESDATVARVLASENPAIADEILWHFAEGRRSGILAAAPEEQREQWTRNHQYPEDSVGRLMDPPLAVLRPEQTVEEVIERLRALVKKALVTYGWVVDDGGRLMGVLVFRELLFARKDQPIAEIMLTAPFSLRPELSLTDAMREALKRHFPVYPVCDASGRLLGIVRGQSLFEQQAFELSAQAGTMVGVEKEERLATPWARSLRFRHPWLQLNLLTAFVAASVVGIFQDTLNELVVLAVFLPVLSGQSGNTGCQALAVALRGITLGELQAGRARVVVAKEALLGLLNGTLVGFSAALAMFVFARSQGNPAAGMLALVVLISMMGSCTASGVAGAVVPLVLRRIGADPATASSIFLTTATDVVSMGMFLGLATWFVL
ncbi:MAG TPA: magnesium transporter [Polyangiaceae bacterium]|nr:magnesium transporter [Polyangiaceae bacterium]